MSFSFKPRRFVVEKHGFGVKRNPTWKLSGHDLPHHLPTAVVQHEHMLRFTPARENQWPDEGLETWCKQIAAVEYDHWKRTRWGFAPMKFEDVGVIADKIGEVGLAEPGNIAAQLKKARDDIAGAEDEHVVTMDFLTMRDDDLELGDLFAEEEGAVMDNEALARADALARPVLTKSLLSVRADVSRSWPVDVPVEIDILPRGSGTKPEVVAAYPTDKSIFGEVCLDDAWLEGAEQTGVLEVEGHFILGYTTIDGAGHPVEVEALRLLPERPIVPGAATDLEFAASAATVTWINGLPKLHWVEDDGPAAIRWWGRTRPD